MLGFVLKFGCGEAGAMLRGGDVDDFRGRELLLTLRAYPFAMLLRFPFFWSSSFIGCCTALPLAMH